MKNFTSTVFLALTFAVGLGLAGCRLPDTLGLDCTDSSQCIGQGTQYCDIDVGKCVAGNDPTDSDSDDGGGDESTDTESESESETTESMKEDMPLEDMGVEACGAAIGSCDKLDVLIVLDNSGSITEDEFPKLIADTDFVDVLLPAITEEPCDVHVGITTTDEAPDFQPVECAFLGALNRGGALADDCWPEGTPPYFSTGDEQGGLLCAIVPGSKYDSNERQMGAMLDAVSSPLADDGGCNEGFLRDDAKLLFILITDEDDDDDSEDPNETLERTGSDGDPNEWFERVQQVKDLEDIGFLALVPTTAESCGEWMPLSGLSDGVEGTAEVADRITDFANLFIPNGHPENVETIDICQDVETITEEINNAREFLDGFCNP